MKRYKLIPIDGLKPLDPAKRLLDEILNDKTLDAAEKSAFYQDLLFRIKHLPHLNIVTKPMFSFLRAQLHSPSPSRSPSPARSRSPEARSPHRSISSTHNDSTLVNSNSPPTPIASSGVTPPVTVPPPVTQTPTTPKPTAPKKRIKATRLPPIPKMKARRELKGGGGIKCQLWKL